MNEHERQERWRRRAWLAVVVLVWMAAAVALRCGRLGHPPATEAPPPEPLEPCPRQEIIRTWVDVLYLNAIAGRAG